MAQPLYAPNRFAFQMLLLASIGATLLQAFSCPEGQTLGGTHCYKVYRPSPKCATDFSQAAANAFCEANGGELVSIHNQTQQDFITSLIKKDQNELAKRLKCEGCSAAKKDYFYWIGLELTHMANGSVNGASWTDGTPVNYGNPLSANFRPPFVTGHPEGSADDGSIDSEVCPPGNEKGCVAIYGFGSTTVGKWTDRKCNQTHEQEQSCSGCSQPASSNSTVKGQSSSSSSSSSEEGDKVDDCRDQAAINGFVCGYCPTGWTMFQGACYMAVLGSTADLPSKCAALSATISSIHSEAENRFVAALAFQLNPGDPSNSFTTAALTGLTMTHGPLGAITSVAWMDGTPVDYGNPTVAPWTTRGTYPWAPAGQFPPQPDNQPPPGNCVLQWLQSAAVNNNLPTTWDDANCPQLGTNCAVCKFV